jgi:2-(1,2-epoxy-1,2-dihydrophenyl)acetyl-CoA isomerase
MYAPLILGIRELEKPVVAAVNGVAAGAGMSLALACDLRVCGESASFIQAFVRIGLVPDAGASFFLPRLVGAARAAELAMLGDTVSAAEALRIGLVNRVVPDSALLAEAVGLAERLARGPRSVGLIKRLLNLSAASDLRSQLAHEEDLQALAVSTDDAVEGVTAFLEKRPADFRGR